MVLITQQSLFAQDSTKALSISGAVDGYYRYNFSNAPGGITNNFTSFTSTQNAFALGMASIRVDATALAGKVTAVADVGFGPRAEEFAYYESANKSSLQLVKQLYVVYKLNNNIKFTAGKFATHVGYEVLDAPLNRNYSMSYLFTNGPFSHTGVKFDLAIGSFGLMAGVANFLDQTVATTAVKTVIGQLSGGTKNGKLKVYLNYAGFYGSNLGDNPLNLKSFSQFDMVVNAVLSNQFNIGINGTLQNRKQQSGVEDPSGSWYGAAVYLNFDPSSKIGITLRSEYISDSKTVWYDTENIFANTLSLNYKLGPLIIIPEGRVEVAHDNFFTKGNGIGTKSTVTALIAAVYKF